MLLLRNAQARFTQMISKFVDMFLCLPNQTGNIKRCQPGAMPGELALDGVAGITLRMYASRKDWPVDRGSINV